MISVLSTTPTTRGLGRPLPLLVVGVLLLRTILLFAAGGLALRTSAAPAGEVMAFANLWIVPVDLISICVVWWLLRRSGRSLGDLTGRFRGRDVAWGLLVLVIGTIALQGGGYLGNLIVFGGPPPVDDSLPAPPVWLGLWSLLLMPITIAVAEELVYRGFGQQGLMTMIGRWPAMLVVAVFFGFQHAALSMTSGEMMLSRVIGTFIGGIAFGIMAMRFRTLWPLIIGHWLLDVLGLGLPMLMWSLS
ncbi:CPBP family intramembrane glutamic endopeptidase [Propionibacteriaceae bacterium Y1700]|uniref:CPBP family intramembrane glutamic endopeptidase n=1 Tax=Microlunatus sp. Y1700 TaxID=3418487 RepID=UPI003DA75661